MSSLPTSSMLYVVDDSQQDWVYPTVVIISLDIYLISPSLCVCNHSYPSSCLPVDASNVIEW